MMNSSLQVQQTPDITKPLTDAITAAQEMIENANFIDDDADLTEGYDYLWGCIRGAMQAAYGYDLQYPYLMNTTHHFSRQGLDNPDAVYLSANLDPAGEYVIEGKRGTSADLSFQVLAGEYTAGNVPDSPLACDDRSISMDDDGSFQIYLGLSSSTNKDKENFFELRDDSTLIVIREVFNDWNTERRGHYTITRLDTLGVPAEPMTRQKIEKKYRVAGKLLTSRVQTWFAFPQFFTYQEPVNTLTVPASTPGGLTSQFSSIGHYQLLDDEAMIVTVPVAENDYQAIQIGSAWYISTDYENHQTSLTAAQSQADPDGKFRYVISNNNPRVANWLETLGHAKGVMMLRWQRLSRELTADDGPTVAVVKLADVPDHLPYYADNTVTEDEYAERIAARQQGVASRMIS